jgi:CRISPR system Cascade subunit CasA
MSKYNLIDEKWIPIRYPDGSRDELGIKEILLRSKEIAAIEDPSPLVVAALHRFLLAVLYRALKGPTDIEQAKQLFKDGLPANKIADYLNTWKPSFWLFDERYPFGQISTFEPKTWRSWTALAAEHNADNAKVLFDHVDVAGAGSISAKSAARWLLATQTFAVSAGKSELSHTGTAPSAGFVMAIPQGCNLADTLILSLTPQNRDVVENDLALWEREPESIEQLKSGIERAPTGFSDLYTWRTRSVRLGHSVDNQVSDIAFASGVECLDSNSNITDPMLGYLIVDVKSREMDLTEKKRIALRFEERGVWRDFDSLLPDRSRLAPHVIENAVELTRRDRKRFPKGIMVLGQRYYPPRPNLAYWRKEFFVLPEAVAGDRTIRSDIRRYLDAAEDVQKALWSACSNFARDLLSRGGRKPAEKDVTACITQMTCTPWFWTTLESKFHEILQHYTFEKSPYEIELEWFEAMREALKDAWAQHRVSASTGDAWVIRALVKAEAPVARKLKELGNKIAEFTEYLKKEGE